MSENTSKTLIGTTLSPGQRIAVLANVGGAEDTKLAIDSHDVIFRLISTVRDDLPDTPLSVCGALAARPEVTSHLINCGITSLSVVPPAIPALKEAVRKCGCS